MSKRSGGNKAGYTPLEILDDLLQFAENAFRFRMKKLHPGISKRALERLVAQWYLERPGAEIGDADGTLRTMRL